MYITVLKSFTLKLLTVGLISWLFSSFFTQGNSQDILQNQHHLMGSHGMVLIHDAEAGFFASHLPLYVTPHNYQIIYKVHIKNTNRLIELLDDGMVTLLPKRFDLSKLIKGEVFSIDATFFQGHFERAGEIKFTQTITFIKPILVKEVSTTFIANSAVFYHVPISEKKAIFAHKIQNPPSFDAIGFAALPVLESIVGKENKEKPNGTTNTFNCSKPPILQAKSIKTQLNECASINIKYLETQDFK
jgi:hypothetical protein